jgi:hypothetical protein
VTRIPLVTVGKDDIGGDVENGWRAEPSAFIFAVIVRCIFYHIAYLR